MAGASPHYVQIGFISITVPNLIVLGLMFAVFAIALALRMPADDAEGPAAKKAPGGRRRG